VEGYGKCWSNEPGSAPASTRCVDPLVAGDPAVTKTPPYQEALLQVLLLGKPAVSAIWGQGVWTDYAREITGV